MGTAYQWRFLPFEWCFELDCAKQPQSNTWVRLLEFPDIYSYEEALLLCQASETEWIAWIPDCGEIILGLHQFCQNSE